MKVGEIISRNEYIVLNEGKDSKVITVANTGDRPIQVGSHFHFFEVNSLLLFEREKSFGYHLDIPSGTSVRFEPGEEKEVRLVEIGGYKKVFGCNDLTCGEVSKECLPEALNRARRKGIIQESEVNS